MPSCSSLGESSLPVSESPAEFQPTESHGTPPSWKIVGSPATCFSIATMCSSAAGRRSFVWPTSRWPSAVALGPATTSLHRPCVAFRRGSYQSSSIEAAKRSSGSIPAVSAMPSSSSTSQGSRGSVNARYSLARARCSSTVRPAGRSSKTCTASAWMRSRAVSPELATHLEMVRCGDPDDVDTWRRGHVVSSPMSDANAPR